MATLCFTLSFFQGPVVIANQKNTGDISARRTPGTAWDGVQGVYQKTGSYNAAWPGYNL